ncbi:hypothetical protein DFH06DRAFT_326628 [Mycena polygramma]|nr:hypothetical protein DFH06DRAFT_326628 [Mycena polygramma]
MSRPVCAACGDGFSSSLAPTPAQMRDLLDILRSNAVPPDVGSFRSAILEAPAELARYDDEIQRLQNVVAKLVADFSTLAAYANRCRSVLSPIRRVPPELWAEIFEMCSPDAPGGQDTNNLSQYTRLTAEVDRISHWHLLQLSQVSSLWRKIALGTPKLWSRLALDTSLWRDTSVSPATLLSLLDVALTRSGNHPLTVEASVLEEDLHPHAAMMLLARHAPRWKSLDFCSDLKSPELLASAKGNLDRLEKLKICADRRAADIFEVAPRLTEVQLAGRVEDMLALPWAQIRSLTFTHVGDPDTDVFSSFSFLGRCPNIITFLSSIAFPEVPVDTPIPAICSSVESLAFLLGFLNDIPGSAQLIVGRIFEMLTLPALRTFFLFQVADSNPPIWHTDHFLALADRSSFHTHLTRLEITAIMTDRDLLRSLAVLPLLNDLVISDCTSNGEHVVATDTLLQGLIRKTDSPTLVPGLQFLTVTSLLRFSDSWYRTLITSRLPLASDDRFEASLWWLPGRRREFPPELVSELSDLECEGEFWFEAGAALG